VRPLVALRLLRVVLHIVRGLLISTLVFPWVSVAGRQRRVQRWSAQLLEIFRVSLEVLALQNGAVTSAAAAAQSFAPVAPSPSIPVLGPGLVVANHVSWLDIFVINSMEPARFVAKSDIRDWPLLGYLCARSGTIFISRGKARDVRNTFKNLVGSIEAGERVAFFPEGTTAAQGTLLPFHANLFEAAIDAGVPVQPLALRYLDRHGALDAGVDYIGDTSFLDSMLTILGGAPVQAQILVLAPLASAGGHRRALAVASHDAISAALGCTPVPLPEVLPLVQPAPSGT
jgi:1-acyl-sn-glycerol-3-phosphate acyltransferase